MQVMLCFPTCFAHCNASSEALFRSETIYTVQFAKVVGVHVCCIK